MKTFYVSLGIFLLTLVLIVCNAVYIHHVTNELQKRLDSLPACERAGDALEALQAYWAINAGSNCRSHQAPCGKCATALQK